MHLNVISENASSLIELNVFKNHRHGPGNDTLVLCIVQSIIRRIYALHGISLASACLTICENTYFLVV